MKLSPLVEVLATGLARSAASARRTRGVSGSPVISGWVSLIHRPPVTAPTVPPTRHDSHGAVQRWPPTDSGGPNCGSGDQRVAVVPEESLGARGGLGRRASATECLSAHFLSLLSVPTPHGGELPRESSL